MKGNYLQMELPLIYLGCQCIHTKVFSMARKPSAGGCWFHKMEKIVSAIGISAPTVFLTLAMHLLALYPSATIFISSWAAFTEYPLPIILPNVRLRLYRE